MNTHKSPKFYNFGFEVFEIITKKGLPGHLPYV
jgi:hypothetical protein